MMTADEKNHVISNANEELDRQIVRLDTVFPYITYEISEEARLGSLAHWAYSNKSAAKAATTERPRREAVINRPDLTQAFEAEAASRSEARREAVLARKQRRAHIDADYEESRSSRKTNSGKSRADHATAEQSVAAKRRRVDRPAVMDMGATMERSASGTGSQRAPNKDGGEKKRSRAPNATTAAARKKYVIAHNTSSLKIINHLFLGPMLRTLGRLFWPPRLLSEPSMPRVAPQAPDPIHHVRNLLGRSRMSDRRAIPGSDPPLLPPIALVNPILVCVPQYLFDRLSYIKLTLLSQPNQWTPDLHPAMIQLNPKQPTQTSTVTTMAILAVEPRPR